MKKSMRESYGLIKADIDTDQREIVLSVKRGRDELSQSTVERCITWAMSRCRDRYPGYRLLVDGGLGSFDVTRYE